MKEHRSMVFRLENAEPPGEQIKKKLMTVLKGIMRKVHRSRSCKLQVEKLNLENEKVMERYNILFSY